MAQKGRLLFEENSKKYYEATEPGLLVQNSGNPTDADAVIGQRITNRILQGLGAIGIHTQYVKQLNMHETLVYDIEKMPIKCRIQLRADEMDANLLDADIGAIYAKPITELHLVKDGKSRAMSFDDLVTLGILSEFELEDYKALMARVTDYLSGFFFSLDSLLVSFEFGVGRQYLDEYSSLLIVTDELSPANAVIWDKTSLGKELPIALDLTELGNRLQLTK